MLSLKNRDIWAHSGRVPYPGEQEGRQQGGAPVIESRTMPEAVLPAPEPPTTDSRETAEIGLGPEGTWEARDENTPEPRSAPGRARALGEVLLCSGLPTQNLLMGVMVLAGATPGFTTSFVLPLLWLDTLLIVGLVWWLLGRSGDSPRRVCFGETAFGREVLIGLVLIFPAVTLIVAGLGALLTWAWPWLHNVADNPLQGLLQTPRDVMLTAVTVVVAGGVREEVQRAFVLTRFRQSLGGAALGLLLFSAAFGAGHLSQGWDAGLLTATLGLMWGLVYLARGSMVAPAVSHAAFDLLQVVQFSLQAPSS